MLSVCSRPKDCKHNPLKITPGLESKRREKPTRNMDTFEKQLNKYRPVSFSFQVGWAVREAEKEKRVAFCFSEMVFYLAEEKRVVRVNRK